MCNIRDSIDAAKCYLDYHIYVVHEGKKPYKCDFEVWRYLHFSFVHSENRPFICNECNLSYKQKQSSNPITSVHEEHYFFLISMKSSLNCFFWFSKGSRKESRTREPTTVLGNLDLYSGTLKWKSWRTVLVYVLKMASTGDKKRKKKPPDFWFFCIF